MNKQEILEKIEAIRKSEKDDRDVFFMCGWKSDEAPNENMMNACEGYLKEADSGSVSSETKDFLISEFEAYASRPAEIVTSEAQENKQNLIKEILANAALL